MLHTGSSVSHEGGQSLGRGRPCACPEGFTVPAWLTKPPVVWIDEVLGTVAGEGSLIGVAPARCEDHQPGNPPLKMSGLARRLNNGEWLADPLPRHGIKARLNHLAPCHDGLRPGGLDVDP